VFYSVTQSLFRHAISISCCKVQIEKLLSTTYSDLPSIFSSIVINYQQLFFINYQQRLTHFGPHYMMAPV